MRLQKIPRVPGEFCERRCRKAGISSRRHLKLEDSDAQEHTELEEDDDNEGGGHRVGPGISDLRNETPLTLNISSYSMPLNRIRKILQTKHQSN
jgi:hypothetical protein